MGICSYLEARQLFTVRGSFEAADILVVTCSTVDTNLEVTIDDLSLHANSLANGKNDLY